MADANANPSAGLAKNVLERFVAISGYALPSNLTFQKDGGGKPTSWTCELQVPDIVPDFRCGLRQQAFYGQALQRKAAHAAAALQALEYMRMSGLAPEDIQNFQVVRKPVFYTSTLEGQNHMQTCVLWQLLRAHPSPVPITKLQLHPDMPKARPHDSLVRQFVLESLVPQGIVQATASATGEVIIGLMPMPAGMDAMWLGAPTAAPGQQAWPLADALLEKLQAAFPFSVPTAALASACAGAPIHEVHQALSSLAAAQLAEEEVLMAAPGIGPSVPIDANWRWISPSMQNALVMSAGIMV